MAKPKPEFIPLGDRLPIERLNLVASVVEEDVKTAMKESGKTLKPFMEAK